MTDRKETENTFRRKRITVLKRLIVLSVIVLLLVPSVLCTVLFVRIQTLSEQVQELSSQLDELRESMDELEEQDLPESGAVKKTQDTVPVLAETPEKIPEVIPEKETAEAIPENVREVYLTFDDGPSSVTNDILDILADYDVKATFFVIGREDEKSQETLRRIVEEGHSLGMHSYSHEYGEIYASVESFAVDLTKLQDYLYEVTGVRSSLYRFPGGSSNTVSKTDIQELIKYLDEKNIHYFDWNVTSKDASKRLLDAAEIVENCTVDLKNHKISVVLMHDSSAKPTTVEALPQILEDIKAMEDTVILPITEDTTTIQHVKAKEETEE